MNLIIGIHMLSYARQISDRDPGSDLSSQQALCVILLLTPRNSNQEPVSEYYGVHGMRKLTSGMHCLAPALVCSRARSSVSIPTRVPGFRTHFLLILCPVPDSHKTHMAEHMEGGHDSKATANGEVRLGVESGRNIARNW